mgnify:CR=1 FL=1
MRHWKDDVCVEAVPNIQRMARRDLKVLDAAEHAADMVNQLLDHPAGLRIISSAQLRRSVHAIAANIMEGFGRGTNGDRARMLRIARGEAEESMQHLVANFRATRISAKEYWAVRNKLAVVVKMLNGLISD